MQPNSIGMIFSVVFIFCALFGALLGFTRGVKRQSVRLITIFLSALVGFFVARSLYPAIVNELDSYTVAELLAELGATEAASEYLTMDMIKELVALPAALIFAPLGFILVYLVASLILLIVHKIVCGVIGFRRKNNTLKTRILGTVLGAVQGVLIGAILCLPVFGLINTADKTVSEIDREAIESPTAVEFLEEWDGFSDEIQHNLPYKIFGNVSGSVYRELACVKIGEQTLYMTDIFEPVMIIISNLEGLTDISFKNPDALDRAVIDSVIDGVEQSDYLMNVLASALRFVSGMKSEEATEGNQNPLLTDLFSLLSDSTGDTLRTDLLTMKEVYYMLADAGLIEAISGGDADILALLTEKTDGETLIARVGKRIEGNTHLAPLTSMLTEYAMTLALEHADVNGKSPEEVKVIVSDVKEGFNEILALDRDSYADADEYKAEVTVKVDEVLSEHEFELTDEELDAVATYIVDNMENVSDLSDADLASLLSEYYAASKNAEGSEE